MHKHTPLCRNNIGHLLEHSRNCFRTPPPPPGTIKWGTTVIIIKQLDKALLVKYGIVDCLQFRGVPRIWQGGGQEFFFPDLEICMSRKFCANLGFPVPFLFQGFGGMPPRENFLKWCNLVCILIRFCL